MASAAPVRAIHSGLFLEGKSPSKLLNEVSAANNMAKELLPCGLLVLDKPLGMTSRCAVDFVERPLRPSKVGHAGTLDPLAEGVLVICVGAATRMIDYVHRLPKRYVASFRLGVSSATLDLESEAVALRDAPEPAREQVVAALAGFRGTIEQRPPAYSAVWVQGKRAYELARRGDVVEISARAISVHSLELVHYEYPDVTLDIACSTGTYIRSLGSDIATALGTAAVMTALARTSIGPFERSAALAVERFKREFILNHLRSAGEAVPEMRRIVATETQRELISHGRMLDLAIPEDVVELAAVDEAGALLAVLHRGERGWRPSPNLIGVQ